MKNHLYKAALVAALGLTGVSAVRAQSSTDVMLGFNDAAGPTAAQNDYVIDLGSFSSLVAAAVSNGGTTVNLWTGTMGTTFTTAFSADSSYDSDVAVGVVEGNTPPSGTQTLLQTINGNPATPAAISQTELIDSASYAQGISLDLLGSSPSGASGSWSFQVAPSPLSLGLVAANGDTVASATLQPLSYLNSGSITETLFENTVNSARNSTVAGWVQVGTFTINPDGSLLTFSVPEPSTYGLLGLGGLLALSLRHRFTRKNT